MKKYILITIMALALLACKGTKEVSSAGKNNGSVSSASNENGKEAVGSTSQTTDNKDSEYNTDPEGVVSQINGSTGGMDNARISPNPNSNDEGADLQEIYQTAQMTGEQIESFERSMTDFKEAVKNDAHGEMRGTIGNEQERQLKRILTKDQWNKYWEWKKNRE